MRWWLQVGAAELQHCELGGSPARLWRRPGGKHTGPTVERPEGAVPGNCVSDRANWHPYRISAEAVLNDSEESTLACLRFTGDNVELPGAECDRPLRSPPQRAASPVPPPGLDCQREEHR